MLELRNSHALYEELHVVFKRYGFDFTRYEILEDASTNCTQIQMYFKAYGKPYALSYEWSQSAVRKCTNLRLMVMMLADYLHKQLTAIDKTETWELVPKT